MRHHSVLLQKVKSMPKLDELEMLGNEMLAYYKSQGLSADDPFADSVGGMFSLLLCNNFVTFNALWDFYGAPPPQRALTDQEAAQFDEIIWNYFLTRFRDEFGTDEVVAVWGSSTQTLVPGVQINFRYEVFVEFADGACPPSADAITIFLNSNSFDDDSSELVEDYKATITDQYKPLSIHEWWHGFTELKLMMIPPPVSSPTQVPIPAPQPVPAPAPSPLPITQDPECCSSPNCGKCLDDNEEE